MPASFCDGDLRSLLFLLPAKSHDVLRKQTHRRPGVHLLDEQLNVFGVRTHAQEVHGLNFGQKHGSTVRTTSALVPVLVGLVGLPRTRLSVVNQLGSTVRSKRSQLPPVVVRHLPRSPGIILPAHPDDLRGPRLRHGRRSLKRLHPNRSSAVPRRDHEGVWRQRHVDELDLFLTRNRAPLLNNIDFRPSRKRLFRTDA